MAVATLCVFCGHLRKIHRVQKFRNISPVLVCICELHAAVYCEASVEIGVEAAGVLFGSLCVTGAAVQPL